MAVTLVVLLKQAAVSLLLQSLAFLVHLLSFILGGPGEILGNSTGLGSCWAFGLSFHSWTLSCLRFFACPRCAMQSCSRPLQRRLTWCHLLASYSWAPLPICRQALLEQFLEQNKLEAKMAADFFCFFWRLIFSGGCRKKKVH